MKNTPVPPEFNSPDEIATWLRENAPQELCLVGAYTIHDLCRDLESLDPCDGDWDYG